MPITGNLNQENPVLDEPEGQYVAVDNTQVTETPDQNQDFTGAEVSSTTVDPDPIGGSSLTHSTVSGSNIEPVQSTSLDITSDFLDGFKETAPLKTNTPAPSSSFNKGFQDAFAAFASAASASYRDDEEEESAVDAPTEEPATTVASKVDDIVSAAADSAGSAAIEPVVSSAIDSGLVTTSGESLVKSGQEADSIYAAQELAGLEQPATEQVASFAGTDADSQMIGSTQAAEAPTEVAAASDSVYFIQMTDASGQVVTSIIDPNDIPSYADSVVYKQCMLPDGEIETTIVYQGGVPVTQEEQPTQEQVMATEEATEQVEQQIIYVHDANGQLTPIDSAQSANDVAPPGKQFVYMQDSTGRIIRTIMDANQTMVPGQQVYYTQSEDGRIITSVMDSATAGVTEDGSQQTVDQLYQQQTADNLYQQQLLEETQQLATSVVGGTAGFNIDNSMSGLSMLAELSHLTAGQAATGVNTEPKTASSTESNSMDMDEFRPVAMVTRRLAGDEGDTISSEIAGLKVGETDSSSVDQDLGPSLSQEDGAGQEDSVVGKILAEMKIEGTNPSYSVSRDNLFVQWQNLDAMCWMDVVLIMLVYSPTLRPLVNLEPTHELASTLLITLLKANRQAQVLLQNLLKKSNGAEISGLQTGAGNTASLQDPKTSKLVCKENMDEIGKAINILYAMREKIWQALQPRLRCERGKHNSPVLVLPLLVREKPAIKQMFTMNYRYVFKCEKCGYSQDDSHTKILPSIPVVPADFNMKAPCFVRNCFECQAPNQRMVMKFEGLQDFVQMHFVKGLPHNRFDELSFDFNDDHYEVTAVVHYKNNPDHFIAWVRNAPGSTWMECDDLKSVITRYLHVSPNIPPGQVHMVMWERRLTAQHTLVMRDTEDTKLLASLVLTVQQPNTHQNTDPASRSGLANTPSFPSASTTQTSSLLSGQTAPTFAPYTPRGRGRGRGSRGSYGGRGRGASMAMPVRRSTPTITQISTPTSAPTLRARTSPQIVRLPLSALRGAASGGARYVLVSGNSQGVASSVGNAGTGSGTSKVVVVRSQGGASNISATELLQLLQRSGAISQAGSRITTTINTSTSGATSSTASYIIQPDGSIVSTSTSGDTQAQPALEQHPTETAEPSVSDAQSCVEQMTESLSAEKEEMQTEEQAQMIPEPEQQISTLPFTPNRELTTANDTIIVSPETGSSTMASSSTDLGTEQAIPAQRTITLTPSQAQANTYIQIPSASGGMILTQLTMRGGKMVLVPVDKNTQAQLTSTSVLKMPNSPSGSPKIAIRAGGASPQIISASSAGALLSQLQQQQSQGIISLAQVSSTNSTVSTVTGPRVITIPGNTPGKKTIQVITVPRGANTSQAGTKTILMGSSAIHQTTATTVGESALEDALSLSGSIKDNVSTLGSSGQLTSTPAVSLLRDVSARSGASLLTSPPSSQQQKSQESFRYILPGSTTTHVVHTGTGGIQSSLGQAGRAFTALSSSGTIIGGQLTPSPTTSAIGTSPMDQDLALGDSDDSNSASGLLMASQRLSREIIDTTEYIPLGRGRARGRGRGRGRGGRTPRGRGRSQLWSSDADYLTPQIGSRKISTLSADLRQIGAHIIESSSEAVDGVPVVSIPDFNTDEPNQPEPDTVTEPMETEHAANIHESSATEMSELQSQMTSEDSQLNQNLTDATLSPTGPRVITQSIPSIKANHGFDILTQGILGGAARSPSMPQVKQARSLLTGSPVSVTHSSLSANSGTTTVLDASSMSAVVSKAQQSLSLGQSVSQSEIDTLIQAAQAAAKPGLSGSTTISFKVKPGVSLLPINVGALGSPIKQDTSFGVEFLNTAENIESKSEQTDEAALQETQTISQEEEILEKEERIMSVDESQVSAAERYRMPSELFQPDEESPEKPLRLEEGVNKLGAELPSKLFQDSEISSQEEEVILTPPHSHKGAARHKTIKEIEMDKMAMMLVNESTSGTKKTQLKGHTLSQPTTKIHGDEESIVGDVDIETSDTHVVKNKRSPAKQKIDHKQRNASSKKASVKKSFDSDANVDDTCIASAPLNENDTNIVTSPKKDQSSSLNKPKSIGGFATDLLLETENEEKQMETEQQMETEEETVVEEEAVKSDTVKDSDNKLVDNVETNKDETTEQVLLKDDVQTTDVGEKVLKEKVENVQPETVRVRRRRIYYPAFVPHKKQRVDWKVEDETEYTDHELQEQCFNYRVLSNKSRAPSLRHPSLGPVQEFFITPPSPLALHRPNKVIDNELLPAVVLRRNPKPLQKPVVDPSKEPTVIPLVAEDEGGPGCTGGSVVTSPNDGEMFSGVIVKKKQEIADWSSSVEEGEDEEGEDSEVEHKYAQREYCKQLLTVLYMEAGDFTSSLLWSSVDDDQDSGLLCDSLKEEESNITADESEQDIAAPDTEDTKQVDVPDGGTLPFEPNLSADLFQDEQGDELPKTEDLPKTEELPKAEEILDSCESVKQTEVPDIGTGVPTHVEGSGHKIVSEEIDQTYKLENLQDSVKETKVIQSITTVKETKVIQSITTTGETTPQTPIVKKRRGRPSKKHAIKPLLEEDPLAGVSHIQGVASDPNTQSSRINGTDKTSSPQVGLKSEPTSLTKDSTAAPSFPSPSRRSSRTPVPSKRVLDSWEESSLRTVLKARRTSIVSSDEEHSGSSNGEIMVKKIKKQTTLPS